MKKLLLLLVVFGALPLFGQGTSFPVFNRQGWTMAGAAVSVCNGPADPGTSVLPCVSSQTTTYTDWTLSVACTNLTSIPNPPGPPMGPTWGASCTNPGLTDSHGNATIFAANGFYWAQIAGYQVVPQTFPFNIGSGGGGGGLIPCGVVNDVQLYGTPGILGCDTGILIGNPSTHTLSDNILNANQQVQVGDTTNSGKIDICQSNGSSCIGHFQMSLNSLVGAGYGVDWPNAAPSASTNCLMAPNTTDSNGRYLMSWGNCGGAGGAVSLEYEYPLDFTNAPSPTTSNDLVRTLFPQAGSYPFIGPPPYTNPLSLIVQDAICHQTTLATLSCSFGGVVTPGNAIYAVGDGICGLGCFINFTFTDSLGNSFTPLDSYSGEPQNPAANAWAPITIGGLDTVTMTVSNPASNYTTQLHIVEIRGVNAVDAHARVANAGSGPTYTLGALTTSNPNDVIIATMEGTGPFAAGSGFAIINQIATDNGGVHDGIATESKNVSSTGTYTPTIVSTGSPTTWVGFDAAFKFIGSLTSGTPYFRKTYVFDQVTQGWFPDPTGLSGDCLSATADPNILAWIACGSGGGDTITSPNSTLTVGGSSSATTLDVAGAAGKMLAGSTPALTYTPALGVDGSQPGTLTLSNGSSPFHTTIGTQASANWTFKLPATAGVNLYVLETDGSGNTSWVAQGASGDSITSPNSTISLGGTSTATTMDLAGAAGKIMAGATPSLTFTPQLGVDNTSAGTLTLSNGSAIAHTIFGSAATTTNTILGPAVVIPNGHLLSCSTSSTTCTLADGGTAASGTVTSVATTAPITGGTITTTGTIGCATCVVASSPGAGIARFAGSTQTVTSAELSGAVTTSGSNATTLATEYRWHSCTGIGLGDGVNAIAAATYPMLGCVNNSGSTMTITAIHCYTDNGGSSTLDVKNNAGTSFLTGVITCNATKTSGGAAGTLGSTVTLATTDALNFTFVADGSSKTTTWTVDVTLP